MHDERTPKDRGTDDLLYSIAR